MNQKKMNLNRKILLSRFIILIVYLFVLNLGAIAQPLSGVKTIGATGNYTSFSAAISALNSNGVNGPIVFNVQAGTYTEKLTLTPITGASATNTITFQSASLDSTDVILSFASQTTSASNYLVYLNGADFIKFQNMSFLRSGTNTYARFFIIENMANNTSIENCLFNTGVSTSNSSNRCFVYSSDDNDTNSTIRNNEFNQGCFGVFLKGDGAYSQESGNRIINNRFNNLYSCPIFMHFLDEPEVLGNTIITNSTYSALTGISAVNCNNSLIISGNKVIAPNATFSRGINISFCDAISSGKGIVSNNFVSGKAISSDDYGIHCFDSRYQLFYNNSVNLVGSNGFAFYIESGGNNDVVNNVFAHTGGFAVSYYTPLALSVIDHNNYYTTGSNFAHWIILPKANLAALKASTGRDVNSISSDPQFISSVDLHSNSPAMNDMGAPLALVPYDIDGEIRNLINPDIGADEYSLIAKDLALLSIQNSNCGLNQDTIEVVYANQGIDTLLNILVTAEIYTSLGTTTLSATIDTVLSGITATITLGTVNTAVPGSSPILKAYHNLGVIDLNILNDTVVVNRGYIPNVNLGLAQSLCTYDSVLLDAGVNPACSFNWSVGGSNQTNLILANSLATGLNNVNVVVTSPSGCSVTDSVDISVNTMPLISATAAVNPIASGNYTTLQGNVVNGSSTYTYSWSPSASINGSNIIQNPITQNLTMNTTFVLTVTDQLTNCMDTASLTVNVISPLSIVASSQQDSICRLDSVQLGSIVTGGGTSLSYSWVSVPVGFTSNMANPKVQVTGSTLYIVTVANSTNTAKDSVFVYAHSLPTASTTTQNSSICNGDSLQVSLNLTGAAPWILYVNDGTGGTSIPSSGASWTTFVKPTTSTTYTVDSIVDGNGCSNISTANVIVSVDPIPIISLGNDTLLKMSWSPLILDPGVFNAYLWQDQSKNQTFTVDPSVLSAGTHIYSVEVTDNKNCVGSDSIEIIILHDVGFDDPTNNTFISLYPNPNNGLFQLNITGISGAVSIDVFDGQGKLVLAKKMVDNTGNILELLDFQNKTKGIYQFRITTENGVYLKRVIIQ